MAGIFDLLKLGAKLVAHKVEQYNLATNETEIVPTSYGRIRGVKRRTIYDDDFYAFEGIPYGKPPVGELRFRAPQPPEPWTDVLDCTDVGNKPLQLHMVLRIVIGSEDCLNLNVYAKQLKTEKPLPVMVYIYGGGFQFGEASRDVYAPDYFMQQDVVLVNLNYREGALGFLSLEDPDVDVPGNAGLKDILLALRWVKENISNFNGDPNNITLFGESAGAASAHFMLLTDKAKGLCHKAILQSGSVFCPWAKGPQWNWAFRLARELGYKGANNDKEVFRFLSKADGNKIISLTRHLCGKEEGREYVLNAFLPVREPYESADCILSKPFSELLPTAWGNDIPLIIGGTSFEGLYTYPHKKVMPYLVNELGDCELVLPAELRHAHNVAEVHEMGLKLKHTYFGDKEANTTDTYPQYLDLMSYKYFWEGVNRLMMARLTYAPQTPTYLYRFDFDSPYFNHYRQLSCDKGVRGTCHGDDVSYLFYNIMASKLEETSPEWQTIKRMVGMWTAFAATTNPNCAVSAPSHWEPLVPTDSTPKCLNISDELQVIDLPEKEKLRVWESFYTKVPLI